LNFGEFNKFVNVSLLSDCGGIDDVSVLNEDESGSNVDVIFVVVSPSFGCSTILAVCGDGGSKLLLSLLGCALVVGFLPLTCVK
jgi:hypothetical protein